MTGLGALTADSVEAVVTKVTDGDTIRADVRAGSVMLGSLSLALWSENTPVRLRGCNAAEVSTEGGKAARDYLRALLPIGTRVQLSAITDYKYGGEIVAAVTLPDGTNLVEQLVAQQWAASWNGSGTRPVPPWPRTVTP